MRTRVKRLIPPSLLPAARSIYYLPADISDTLLGRRRELVPPKRLANVGGGDFEEIGNRFLRHFIELGGLESSDRVLDVGCGVGRMAVPLTRYLNSEGSYEGFDIVAKEVEWCRREITSRHPNFRFQVADIHNREYNPKGTSSAAGYRFPYPDGSFDFAISTSVFTHLLPDEVDNYLSEISRVLKPGGRCLATFFLLDEASRKSIARGRSAMDFPHDYGHYRLKEREVPEAAIAFDLTHIEGLCKKYGMPVERPVRRGSWSGLGRTSGFQDSFVARRV